MGKYVLYGCTALNRINSSTDGVFNIPTGVGELNEYSFYGCSKLQKFSCGKIDSIGRYAFYDCKQLSEFNTTTDKKIEIKDGCKFIGEYAFANCQLITSLTVSDTVATIGAGAFSGCGGLQSVTLPFVGQSRCAFQSSGNWLTANSGVTYSPSIGHSASTTCTLEIVSSGVLSFYYKTSTEADCDKLTVYKNDSALMTASGNTGYTYYEIEVNVGDKIKFTYSKDSSRTSGEDRVYLNFCPTYFSYIFGVSEGYVNQNNLIPTNLTNVTITSQEYMPDHAFYGDEKLVD